MRHNTFFTLIPALLIMLSCASAPVAQKPAGGAFEIPYGTYRYDMTVNGNPAGLNTVTVKNDNGRMITESVSTIEWMGVRNSIAQRVIETADGRAIESETTVTVKRGSFETKTITRAKAHGNEIRINDDGLERSVVVNGNYSFSEGATMPILAAQGFAPGSVAKVTLFDPVLNPEGPVTLTEKITGRQKMDWRGKKLDLIRSVIDLDGTLAMTQYFDERGVAYIIEHEIMNLKFRMVLQP